MYLNILRKGIDIRVDKPMCGVVMAIFLLLALGHPRSMNAQSPWRMPMIGDDVVPLVIFKADDLGGINSQWQTFFNTIRTANICASIGIISDNVNGGIITEPDELSLIVQLHNEMYLNSLNDQTSRFQFWNHTKAHLDLTTLDVEHQLAEIKGCQDFFNIDLGFQSAMLAAPENKINPDTKTAINNYNDLYGDQLKIWMNSGFDPITDKSGWNFLTPFSYGTDYHHLLLSVIYADDGLPADSNNNFQLSYSDFITKYDTTQNVYVIELHPAGYNNDSFDALNSIITFLNDKHARFVTPSYLYGKANVEHYCGDYYSGNSSPSNAINTLEAGYLSTIHTTTCDHTIIHSNASINFTATTRVRLTPGFKAESGSAFHAYINSGNGFRTGASTSTPAISHRIVENELAIALYPNPNDGVFTIDFSDRSASITSIRIFNSQGQEVETVTTRSSKEIIDLSNQPRGLYTIRVFCSNDAYTYKVIKQ